MLLVDNQTAHSNQQRLTVDVIKTAIAHSAAPGPRMSVTTKGPDVVTTSVDSVLWSIGFSEAVYVSELCRSPPNIVYVNAIHDEVPSLPKGDLQNMVAVSNSAESWQLNWWALKSQRNRISCESQARPAKAVQSQELGRDCNLPWCWCRNVDETHVGQQTDHQFPLVSVEHAGVNAFGHASVAYMTAVVG